MNDSHHILGVDIGGTSIKAAVVDTRKGALTSAVLRARTPQPSTPKSVVAAITELARKLKWRGPVLRVREHSEQLRGHGGFLNQLAPAFR